MHITRRNFLIGAQVLAAMVMSIAAPSTVLAATLHLAGDSTLDDCGFKYPYRSWGREVETYLKSGNAIANLAKSGHSTKSFDTDGEWAKLMAEVKPGDFPVSAFGAKPDGSKCTEAFAAAFAAAEKAGGGRVIVPRGKWFTGAIRFRSNCELHLEDSAEVLFSQDPDDYLPAAFTSWEGMECWNYCPLVYAYGCTNVAITGKGTLRAYEGRWEDTKWYPWVPQKNGIKAARLQLYTWGATDYPVEKREIWKMPNAHTRPHFIQFNRCRNVRLEDFKVRNSPFWTIHLYLCEDASVRGLDVYAHGNNNDGIDIEMSKNVLVEKCVFDQGDDGVVIKSGRNRDAWRIGKPTENVLVRDCEIRNAHTVFGIGSEISGGVRNVRMKDCAADDVNRVFYT